MKNKIFITMDGGLLQDVNVSEDLKEVEIIVVDFDTEGSRLSIKKTPEGENALIWEEPINIINDEKRKELWEEILKARKN